MAQARDDIAVRARPADNRSPPVEVAIRAPVSAFELLARHAGGTKHRVAGVVPIPVVHDDAPLRLDSAMKRGARVRRQDVKRRGLDAVIDRPVDRLSEHGCIVVIHAEDEAAVDHHAEIVQAANRIAIIAPQVLVLALLQQIPVVECFEADEQAAES